MTNGTATLYTTVGALNASNGSQVTVVAQGSQVSGVVDVWSSVVASGGSKVTWLSNATITTLILQTQAVFDKSLDARPMVVVNATIDGDSCQVLDPLSKMAWTNPIVVNGLVSNGPFVFLGTRSVKIT